MEIDREDLEHIAERAAERVLMECPNLDTANDFLEAMTIFRQAKTIMNEIFEEHLTRLDKGYNLRLAERQIDDGIGLRQGAGEASEKKSPLTRKAKVPLTANEEWSGWG